jgi:hypothetical protein
MTLISDWTISLTIDDVLHGQGADPYKVLAQKPRLIEAAEKVISDAQKYLHPVALFSEIPIIERRHEHLILGGNRRLNGALLSRHLGGAKQVIPVVCTIGKVLEDAVSDLLDRDPLYAFALDGLGNAAVDNLSQQICGKIAANAKNYGMSASTPLNPGVTGWPVEIGQPQIMALLDVNSAGITLSSGGMMIPKKSSSFVVGIGVSMHQMDICDVCSMKENCRYRHG